MTNEQRSSPAVTEFLRGLWTDAQQTIGRAENQITSLTSRLVERGHATQEEVAGAFGDTLKKLRRNREEMAFHLEHRLEKMAKRLRLPTRSELFDLQHRVAALRLRIDKLAKRAREAR